MNSFLHSLDIFFKDKSENEKWMIIMMLTVVIGYISYSLFLPYAEEKYNSSIAKKNRLDKSIRANNQYIRSITVGGDRDYYIKKYDSDILSLEKNIKKTNDDINFISAKLEELSPLLFNKESWSIFLNSITAQAKKQAVKLDYINNNYIDSNGSFGHILEISVGCIGDYKSIVKFMNRLEKNILVTDIYQSDIRLENNNTITVADINISVWGINH
jgi:lipopolysaccharide export LptBFGC system permease protein LptF